MDSEAPKVFESWRDLMTDLNKLSEDELRNSINFEVSTYGRASFIKRMHMPQRLLHLRKCNFQTKIFLPDQHVVNAVNR